MSVAKNSYRHSSLMVQGTTSDAGKSTLVAALCRILYRQGISVTPFKPQNMALNSAVTINNGEIGRAQAVQAQASGLSPHTDMNPVLLKPNSDTGAQVIVNGQSIGNQDAETYHAYKKIAKTAVFKAYDRLCHTYETIVIEGAGSPAEINLRANDIANMGFAEQADCPVILIADIDKGGMFAHLVGTLALLSESEQIRIKGFVINRFRGELSLLQDGLDWLESYTAKPVLGVIPYIHGLHLEAEDALPLASDDGEINKSTEKFRIAVPVFPRISNHTDFDPLRFHPDVSFCYIGPEQNIPPCDLIILPGSKSVRADLRWLRAQGWGQQINKHLRYGGKLIGICGGYQMLGKHISDPNGIEGEPGVLHGLGLLNIETLLAKEKQLKNISGHLFLENAAFSAYEIHAGCTQGEDLNNPVLRTHKGNDGAMSSDNAVLGCYAHGLFESPHACNALLKWAGLQKNTAVDYQQLRERQIDRLADVVEKNIDMDNLMKIMRRKGP